RPVRAPELTHPDTERGRDPVRVTFARPVAHAEREPDAHTDPGASTNGFDLILKPPLVFLPLAGLAGLIAAVGWWLFTAFPRRQGTLPSAAITHRSTRPTWGGAPESGPAREGPRPAWPTSPPLPAEPRQSEPPRSTHPEFPDGTDQRPHWPAPRPPIADDSEEAEQPPPEIDG
ncbi:MAG TPA: hypothetical protein VER07_01195, partial [Candidatus Polarisedimenticolia bacterium]|nr:hypothetical protein [Candidatus Polarisedimenticolia bacterium]